MKNILFHSGKHKPWPSFALLLLRASFGLMMLTHGWPKLINFSSKAGTFPDPLATKEMSMLYLAAFTTIMILGPGSYSLDKAISGK
jgi:putative oxidoreductase